MVRRFAGFAAATLFAVTVGSGCSSSESSTATAEAVEASPMVPPAPPGTTSTENVAWQSPPLPTKAASPPPVSTEVPPGFVEVVPESKAPAREEAFVPVEAPPKEVSPPTTSTTTEVEPPRSEPKEEEAEEPAVPEAPADAGTPAIALFMKANEVTLARMKELQATLASVEDDKSAREAAAKLPAITDAFIAQSKVATGLYVALSDDDRKQAIQVLQREMIRRIQEEKILNLGLFAGYVVACKVATEAQAAEMFERLSAGLGELTAKEKRRLAAARRAGRRTECPDGPLKTAVERGWANYAGASFKPEPPPPPEKPAGEDKR